MAAEPKAPVGRKDRRRVVSIRWALTLSFSGIIVLLAASLLLLGLLERRGARTDLARIALERALARTNGDLDEIFEPMKRQLAIDLRDVRMGNVPRYDAGEHVRHFLPALRELPMVRSMMAGDTAGHQLLLMRYDSMVVRSPLLEGRLELTAVVPNEERFVTRDFRPALRRDRSVWQLWSAQGSPFGTSWVVPLPGYDARESQWYRQAVERFSRRGAAATLDADPDSAIVWSEVYRFFTTREAGLAASFATRDPSGHVVVIAYSMLLAEISRYSRAQAPTPNGRVVVVSDSGWVIGHPGGPRFADPRVRAEFELQPVERLGDPAFSAWAAEWRARGDQTSRIQRLAVGGVPWWSGFAPFELAPGRRLWIGVMVPESDVVGSAASGGTIILLASAIALLLAFGVAARLARSVADPLDALAEQSARIRRLDVMAHTTPPNTRFSEVRQLSTAIERMRRALEENFSERERAAKALAESESRLLQSQKLEAVGQLAGGVAHDFNNLLTAIRGYVSLLRDHLSGDQAGLDDLQEIDAAALRAAELTSQLLAFSRRQHVETRLVDVNAAVAEAVKLLARLMDARVVLETVYESELPAVRIDPGQLHQVLVNLAVNARDAMPDGGTLTITTSRGGRIRSQKGAEDAMIAASGLPPIVISVVDTGAGMSAEVRARAFEPFFTTKEKGRGTGLGLATCWGIVADAGGALEIDSAPGEGTVVQVILPAIALPATVDSSPVVHERASVGDETLLLVEDEDQIRALADRALTRAGYRVIAAPDGVAALELLREHGARVDLVVTDVVMPRMGGPVLARAVREQWPQTPVLFMTGYAEAEAFGAEGLPATAAEVLRKPFTPSELVRAVRTVLDTPRAH